MYEVVLYERCQGLCCVYKAFKGTFPDSKKRKNPRAVTSVKEKQDKHSARLLCKYADIEISYRLN